VRGAPLLLLGAAILLVAEERPAAARPEFARREGKACGYCHINPRGGGPRNERGLAYARNDFSFPARKPESGALRPQAQEAFARVERLLDLDHTQAAVAQLRRLVRGRKDDPARLLAEQRLHELEVRGTEILGRARLLLRGQGADEGIELLVLLALEFKELEVAREAKDDLRELERDPEHRERIRREEREAKARLLFLDGMLQRADGQAEQGAKTFQSVAEGYDGTRAAKLARAALDGKEPADVAEAEAAARKDREGARGG
jgi:hypothetical protein